MSDEDLVVVELVVEAWALNLYSERYLLRYLTYSTPPGTRYDFSRGRHSTGQNNTGNKWRPQ